ncbi:Uncharacterized protein Rs2_35772 [Raphanus sativus]|nr:Uncharacterized protein Rs2_35772 [Raphanus sativus]
MAKTEKASNSISDISLEVDRLGGRELELPLSHESGDTANDVASPIIDHQEIPTDDHEEDLMNDAPTPTIATRENSSSTFVLESNEDDMMNDDATEIITPQGSYSNTHVLEATENETRIFELELPISHESGDTMNDVVSPIIDHQEIPTGETMSTSDDKIVLPKRVIEAGTEGRFLDRITKRSNLKLVDKEDLWFSFGEQPMWFSLREFRLATGLPCIADIDEEQVETSGRKKKKKKDPWMNKEQTLNSLVRLLEKNSKEFTDDQRLRLGASILVEGILMAINPVTRIPVENLLRARDFKEFCNYPWGNLAFNFLRNEVKDVDIQFGKVLDLVRRGYRLKRQDWLNGSVNIAVAEAEVEKNNYDGWIDATDKEKIEFLTKQAEFYKERAGYLEGLLNIRRENEKENGQNSERELGEEETF